MEVILQLAMIGGTIGLLWLSLQGLRRLRGPEVADARVQVRQRVPLARGCELIVLRWDGREMLLAAGSQVCTLVATRQATELQPQTEAERVWAR